MRKPKSLYALCLLSVLLLLLGGCAADSDDAAASLAAENAALQDEIDALKAQLGVSDGLRLTDWNLTAAAWDGSGGADITLTAAPAEYVEGMEAELLIYLAGSKVASVECAWNGSEFEGTVGIPAADGYSFYCKLTDSAGRTEQVELSSPDNLIKDTLVNLKTGMSAYCNLVLEGWSTDGNTLFVGSCFAQVQLPRIAPPDTTVGYRQARLVLQLNGEETDSRDVELPVGEGEESFEATLTDIAFALPAMAEEDQLDLILEAALTDGTVLSVSGGSWYISDGALTLIVG